MELPKFVEELSSQALVCWVLAILVFILLLPQLFLLCALLGGMAWCLWYLIHNGPNGPRRPT